MKRLVYVAVMIIYSTCMGCTVARIVAAQDHAQPCYTDTECMERFGGDGGPGQ